MPSPDAAVYKDLTLYDQDAEVIFAAAKQAITAKFPDLVLVEPSIEATLLEAMAVEVADLGVMVNRLPGAVVEVLLKLFTVVRSLGIVPTATATFTLADSLGHTVPAGTRLRFTVGQDAVDFTTDVDLVVAPGSSSGTVAVTGATYSAAANGVAVGAAVTMLSNVVGVASVAFATSPAGGSGPEDDSTYFARAMNVLARQVTTLVRPEHFTAAAVNEVANGVYRATTIDQSDGTGAAGTAPGHVAVAVAGKAGALLSSGQKASILADLQAMAYLPLTVHVIDPTITSVAITASVVRKAGFAAATVQAAILAALTSFLSPDTWTWGGVVRFYDLIALIEGVAGVDHVVSLTVPNADVSLAGVANLVTLGATTITVT